MEPHNTFQLNCHLPMFHLVKGLSSADFKFSENLFHYLLILYSNITVTHCYFEMLPLLIKFEILIRVFSFGVIEMDESQIYNINHQFFIFIFI